MISKLKKIIKREYLFFIFLFLVIFSYIVVKEVTDLDEIWNYNCAKQISEGLVPYRDISMIVTPLMPAISGIFLFLFSDSLLMMRILAALLCTGIFFVTFKILEKLTGNTKFGVLCTLLLLILLHDKLCIDYNYMALFLILLILYIELKVYDNRKLGIVENSAKTNKITIEPKANALIGFSRKDAETNKITINKKANILIGFLLGLLIVTKHTIGLIATAIVCLYPVIFIRSKNDFKLYIKMMLQRVAVLLVPVLILLIYLLATGALDDFISYSILGIKTFTNSIPYSRLYENDSKVIQILARIAPYAIAVSVIVPIALNCRKHHNNCEVSESKPVSLNYEKTTTVIMAIYIFTTLMIMYPISDQIHFLMATYILFMNCLYLLYLALGFVYRKIKFVSAKKKFFWANSILIVADLLLLSFTFFGAVSNYEIYFFTQKEQKNHGINHYQNIAISDILKQRIIEIDNYIKENQTQGIKTYILDSEAAVYNIPLDIYNKDYDMFDTGNFGKDGNQGIIRKIEHQRDTENCVYLIKESGYNWQTPMEVINYIKANLEKVGEVSFYNIYK